MEILNIDYARMMVEDHSDDNKVAVLFIAGVSGGVFTNKFDKLKDKILEKGYAYVPIEIWKDANDINKVTIQNIFSSIDNAVSKLKNINNAGTITVKKYCSEGPVCSFHLLIFKTEFIFL